MAACDYYKDCSKIPIPEKCVKYCLERVLRTLTLEEKQLILGLEKDLAEAIYNAYNSLYGVNSFADLERTLSNMQITTLLERFRNINQFQLNYFRKSREERMAIIEAIRNMHLDLDADEWLSLPL